MAKNKLPIKKDSKKKLKTKSKKLKKVVSAKNKTAKKLIVQRQKTHKIKSSSRGRFISAKETKTLEYSGISASTNAIKEAKALGLSITYLQNGILYREKSDGTRIAIGGRAKIVTKRKLGGILLKKGMIFMQKINECAFLLVQTDRVKALFIMSLKNIIKPVIFFQLTNL